MPKAGIIFFGTMAPCCSRVSKLVSGWLFDTYVTSRSSCTSRNWRIDIAMLIPETSIQWILSFNCELVYPLMLEHWVPWQYTIEKKKHVSPKGPSMTKEKTKIAKWQGFMDPRCGTRTVRLWDRGRSSTKNPWRIRLVLLLIWCAMDPINKNPSHVSINLPAPWIRHGSYGISPQPSFVPSNFPRSRREERCPSCRSSRRWTWRPKATKNGWFLMYIQYWCIWSIFNIKKWSCC